MIIAVVFPIKTTVIINSTPPLLSWQHYPFAAGPATHCAVVAVLRTSMLLGHIWQTKPPSLPQSYHAVSVLGASAGELCANTGAACWQQLGGLHRLHARPCAAPADNDLPVCSTVDGHAVRCNDCGRRQWYH
jgi:hypothetical protein